MPTQITVIRGSEFIIATPQGEIDVEASRKVLVKISQFSATSGASEILLDMRMSESKLSVTNLWYLAAGLGDLPTLLSGKIAVLTPVHRFGDAEFFALCAQNRGFPIQAFTSFEDAVIWLIEGEPQLLDDLV